MSPGEEPLPSEVLDGAQPVDVGGQILEAGKEPPDLLPGPEVQHLFLGAEASCLLVDPSLAPGHDGHEQQEKDGERPGHWKSRDRNEARPRPSTIATKAAAYTVTQTSTSGGTGSP